MYGVLSNLILVALSLTNILIEVMKEGLERGSSPHSRYFFMLIPHLALVFFAFPDPVFCFQKTYVRKD